MPVIIYEDQNRTLENGSLPPEKMENAHSDPVGRVWLCLIMLEGIIFRKPTSHIKTISFSVTSKQ